jgi:hypothetical protein
VARKKEVTESEFVDEIQIIVEKNKSESSLAEIIDLLSFFFDNNESFNAEALLLNLGLEPVHVGALVQSNDLKSIKLELSKAGFSISNQFPSSVVSKILIQKYQRDDIQVTILKASDDEGHEMELFVCEEGLSLEEIKSEVDSKLHFAYKVDGESSQALIAVLIERGYLLNGGGYNEIEDRTALYFFNEEVGKSGLTIELFIEGDYSHLM